MTEYEREWKAIEQNRPNVVRHKKQVIRKAIMKTCILEVIVIAILWLLLKDRMQVMLTVMLLGAVVYSLLWVKLLRIIRTPYVGRIEKIEQVQKRVSVGGAASSFYTSMRDAIFIKCTVKENNGKSHVFELPASYSIAYQQGDIVLSTSGIYYPINLTQHEQTVCPCCNSITPSSKENCIACHFDMRQEEEIESC